KLTSFYAINFLLTPYTHNNHLINRCFFNKCEILRFICFPSICIVGFLAIIIISTSGIILSLNCVNASRIKRLILFRVTAFPIFFHNEMSIRKYYWFFYILLYLIIFHLIFNFLFSVLFINVIYNISSYDESQQILCHKKSFKNLK